MKPDMNKKLPKEFTKFNDPKNNKMKIYDARKVFETKTEPTKTYQTPTFLGMKVPWFAKKEAKTSEFYQANSTYSTSEFTNQKTVAPIGEKSFYLMNQTLYAQGKEYPVRKATLVGKDQKNLSNRQLTNEEVRTLLNKK